MSQHRALISADLAYLDRLAALPALAVFGVRVAVLVTKWGTRRQTRKSLRALERHELNDIGITRHMADLEAEKRFWQA